MINNIAFWKNGFLFCDYRSLSSIMWESQPQFDTIGEHRFFIYRKQGGAEHDSAICL